MSAPSSLCLVLAAAALALAAGPAAADELERELARELRRNWPPIVWPLPQTLACYQRLAQVASFGPLPVQAVPPQCAVADLVRITAIKRPAGGEIAMQPPAVLRCGMAEAVAEWVRVDVEPALRAATGAELAAVVNADSYGCRGRNRVPGAKLSEHGKGNAIDISALRLTNKTSVVPTDVAASMPLRERLKADACARFTTVLGPGSDGYHEEHIHLDLARRSRGYRICQWNVLDLAALAGRVPLPRSKPDALKADPTGGAPGAADSGPERAGRPAAVPMPPRAPR